MGTTSPENPTPKAPWEQFEFYLRVASNYGLAIFLVLYYVIVIQPREASTADNLRKELVNVQSDLETLSKKNEDIASRLLQLDNESSRKLSDLLNQVQELHREANASSDIPADRFALIRDRVAQGFQEHVLDSLASNTHSRQYFPDEIRQILCQEFRLNSPY